YTPEGAPAGLFFRALTLAAAVGFAVLCFVGERRRWTAFTVASDGMGARATLALGLFYLAAAAVMLFSMVRAGLSILSLAAAIGFAAVALMMLKNSAAPAVAGLLQVALSLLLFFKTIEIFNADLVIGNRSDSLLLLLSYVFGALFFASSARCYARIETKHSRLRELILAGLTLLFSGAGLFAKLLSALFGGAKTLGVPAPDPTAAALLLISLGFIASLCFTEQKKAIVYLVTEVEEKKAKKQKKKADRSADTDGENREALPQSEVGESN
ncbi:MAG: hypothetical protein NC237_00520, partial [Eubacterium sp.]|nr:hypothetical protein [Eubacterium sp.]